MFCELKMLMKDKVILFLWLLLKVGSQEIRGEDMKLQRGRKEEAPTPKSSSWSFSQYHKKRCMLRGSTIA